jgi:hypothetical protein
MKAHDLAYELLAGPDVTAVVPTYDEDDHERHVEVTASELLPEVHNGWFDTNSALSDEPAVEISTAAAA